MVVAVVEEVVAEVEGGGGVVVDEPDEYASNGEEEEDDDEVDSNNVLQLANTANGLGSNPAVSVPMTPPAIITEMGLDSVVVDVVVDRSFRDGVDVGVTTFTTDVVVDALLLVEVLDSNDPLLLLLREDRRDLGV